MIAACAPRRFEPKRVIVSRARARAAKRMPLRKTHRSVGRRGAGACAHQFGQLHRALHAFRCSQAADRNPRILRVEQTLRDLPRLRRIHGHERGRLESRNLQLPALSF